MVAMFVQTPAVGIHNILQQMTTIDNGSIATAFQRSQDTIVMIQAGNKRKQLATAEELQMRQL